MIPKTELWLARHGETDWNAVQRFQGQTDIDLNARGLDQAQRLALRLQDVAISAVYSSDLSRALMTARPTAQSHRVEIVTDGRLRERHFGKFEGHTYTDIEHRFPEDFLRWQERDLALSLDGGETLSEVSLRVSAVLQSIAQLHAGQSVLVVTHGGVLDLAYRFMADLPLQTPKAWATPNAATSRTVIDRQGWHVLHWADTSHLLN